MKNIWNKNPIFLGETKKSILSKGHRPTLKITLKDSTSFWAFYYNLIGFKNEKVIWIKNSSRCAF